MASNVSLNPEPSKSEERAEHNLPPKSYAAAAQEPANTQDIGNSHQPNGTTNGSISGFKEHGYPSPDPSVDSVDGNKLVYEKRGNLNRDSLTSVEPEKDYQNALQHNEETKPRNRRKKLGEKPSPELASGRRAGAGWERSAIRWAPLNVPVQRRLQTLMILWHTTSIPLFLTLFLWCCAIPLAWPIVVPYIVFVLIFDSHAASNGSTSRRSKLLRGSKLWSLFASYFPIRLHRTVELPSTRKYIFGYHPHGIISHGGFAAFATEALGFSELYPGITNSLCTLDSNFNIPFYRDYALAMGLISVSRESIEAQLSTGGIDNAGMGKAVTIVVGGARESLDAQPGTLRLVLNARKGFVKLAIRMGADLVPVLAFGENDLYDQVDSDMHPWIHKMQMLVKKIMGFTVPLFHARGVFNYDVGLMPYRRSVNLVVGRPIQVLQQGEKDGRVDERYLDEVHARYVEELKRIWDAHKDTFAKERIEELEIME
ncbi:MAG: hypothetical protein Q9227_006009 [Pyrenula ochraceoflavens]